MPRTEPGDANGLTESRARDHLANERTYVSWLRTTLGLATRALAVPAYGTKRYYQVARDVEEGRFGVTGLVLFAILPLVVT